MWITFVRGEWSHAFCFGQISLCLHPRNDSLQCWSICYMTDNMCFIQLFCEAVLYYGWVIKICLLPEFCFIEVCFCLLFLCFCPSGALKRARHHSLPLFLSFSPQPWTLLFLNVYYHGPKAVHLRLVSYWQFLVHDYHDTRPVSCPLRCFISRTHLMLIFKWIKCQKTKLHNILLKLNNWKNAIFSLLKSSDLSTIWMVQPVMWVRKLVAVRS